MRKPLKIKISFWIGWKLYTSETRDIFINQTPVLIRFCGKSLTRRPLIKRSHLLRRRESTFLMPPTSSYKYQTHERMRLRSLGGGSTVISRFDLRLVIILPHCLRMQMPRSCCVKKKCFTRICINIPRFLVWSWNCRLRKQNLAQFSHLNGRKLRINYRWVGECRARYLSALVRWWLWLTPSVFYRDTSPSGCSWSCSVI